MLGYARVEQIGRTSKELGIWRDPGTRERIIAKLKEKGSFRNERIRFRTKTGGERHVLWSGEVVVLGGRPVLLSLLQDETSRRLAETSLMARTRAFLLVLSALVVALLVLVVWLLALLRQRQSSGMAIR